MRYSVEKMPDPACGWQVYDHVAGRMVEDNFTYDEAQDHAAELDRPNDDFTADEWDGSRYDREASEADRLHQGGRE